MMTRLMISPRRPRLCWPALAAAPGAGVGPGRATTVEIIVYGNDPCPVAKPICIRKQARASATGFPDQQLRAAPASRAQSWAQQVARC